MMTERKPQSQEMFNELADSLFPDLPLIMHGSGDVHPNDVNPATVSLLSFLVARYIRDLVDAAVDAHDILTDGSGRLMPPASPFPKDDGCRGKDIKSRNSRKRTRWNISEREDCILHDAEDWELPLSPAKICRKDGNNDMREDEEQIVSHDEWQGTVGIDLNENYIRSNYSSIPYTIGPQSFVFPICHDPILYSRVREIQSARRNITDVLMDPVVAECIREEGPDALGDSMFEWVKWESLELYLPSAGSEKRGKSAGEEEDETDKAKKREMVRRVGLEAKWPGLDRLLPVYGSDIL